MDLVMAILIVGQSLRGLARHSDEWYMLRGALRHLQALQLMICTGEISTWMERKVGI
jgi:hypothetical protein